jgi:hypothetical protein
VTPSLHRVLFLLFPFGILLLQGLLDLLAHNPVQTGVNLAFQIYGQSSIRTWNVVPQEQYIKHDGNQEGERCNDPNDEGEQHGGVDGYFLLVGVGEMFNVDEELLEVRMAVGGFVLSIGYQTSLHDGPERESVDHHSRSFGQNDDKSTLRLRSVCGKNGRSSATNL